MDYGLDPCMVKSIGGNVVTSCSCIGDIKVLQTLFALSFASEVHAGLRAALHSSMVVMRVVPPRIFLDIDVVFRAWSLFANFLAVNFTMRVFTVFFLVFGSRSSKAQFCSVS